MAKAKPIDVLAELDALAPKRKTWLERASPEARAKLLEIKQLRQAGECTHSVRTIHALATKYGAAVCAHTLGVWLDAKED